MSKMNWNKAADRSYIAKNYPITVNVSTPSAAQINLIRKYNMVEPEKIKSLTKQSAVWIISRYAKQHDWNRDPKMIAREKKRRKKLSKKV